jgi:hypothetical protein
MSMISRESRAPSGKDEAAEERERERPMRSFMSSIYLLGFLGKIKSCA